MTGLASYDRRAEGLEVVAAVGAARGLLLASGLGPAELNRRLMDGEYTMADIVSITSEGRMRLLGERPWTVPEAREGGVELVRVPGPMVGKKPGGERR